MSLVLCLHTTYTHVESALASDGKILAASSLAKELASAQLITTIDSLLSDSNVTLSDVSHIIVNQGPAPFTTLRTIIATVNGIAFAHTIPLVGVDALEAFTTEYAGTYTGPTVVLLNAFNKAVYYCITDPTSDQKLKGYAPIATCLELIQKTYPNKPVHCIGNGTQLYRTDIEADLGSQAFIPDPLPLTVSIEQIIKTGINQIQNNQGITQCIEPLYLKKPLG